MTRLPEIRVTSPDGNVRDTTIAVRTPNGDVPLRHVREVRIDASAAKEGHVEATLTMIAVAVDVTAHATGVLVEGYTQWGIPVAHDVPGWAVEALRTQGWMQRTPLPPRPERVHQWRRRVAGMDDSADATTAPITWSELRVVLDYTRHLETLLTRGASDEASAQWAATAARVRAVCHAAREYHRVSGHPTDHATMAVEVLADNVMAALEDAPEPPTVAPL